MVLLVGMNNGFPWVLTSHFPQIPGRRRKQANLRQHSETEGAEEERKNCLHLRQIHVLVSFQALMAPRW